MPGLKRSKPSRRPHDWQIARERLARLAANDGTPDPGAAEQILNERAAKLARLPPSVAERASAERLELLEFRLGRERYAIETRFMHQVLKPGEVTRLPGAPDVLRGVTNLRGDIVLVFDLRELLEAERTAPSDDARWLLLGAAEPEFCLWADAVLELFRIDPRRLRDAERDGGRRHAFVRGVTPDAQSVLDATLLFTHRKLFIGDAPDVGEETAG